MKRPLTLWILALIITLTSAVYQRLTGPTYPVSGGVQIGNENIGFRLLRNHETTSDAVMTIQPKSPEIKGQIRWKRYKSRDPWTTQELKREEAGLIVSIPRQPAAGKVIYEVSLFDAAGVEHDLTDGPIIIRFKDPVPDLVLVPHIIFIFIAMLFSTRAGLEAVVCGANTFRLTLWTTVLMFVGGLIFGPAVQRYAFGEFWTGWPFGHDLTDTKTFVAFIFWPIALWRARIQGRGRVWTIVASIVTLVIFLIPHSVLGSELDYTKMENT